MSNGTSSSSSGGIGFFGLLTIVFITLKLVGYIDWSWWWVLSPIWIAWGIFLSIIAVVLIGAGCSVLFAMWLDARDNKRKAK